MDIGEDMYKLIATTTFGLEAICKRELETLGYKIEKVENGKVHFQGDFNDIARANIWLRTSDRILINLGSFKAETFEELFDNVYKINFQDIIPENGNFVVNGKSIKSKLFSISDCQRITEKAIVEKLKTKYKTNWFEKTGALYKFEVALLNDMATITLDTTGPSLHRRGYRTKQGLAPIKETLAAAMVDLSFWNKDRVLYDPFCGTSTILIEAAMIGKNIAPGKSRGFSFTNWTGVDRNILLKAREEAEDLLNRNEKLEIYGTDIDPEMIDLSNENIKSLGLKNDITVKQMDFRDFPLENNYGVLITNPPYGERFNEINVDEIERDLGKKMKALDTWSNYIITSNEMFERNYGKRADRKRKLYNGRLKVDYYQYYGPRPE